MSTDPVVAKRDPLGVKSSCIQLHGSGLRLWRHVSAITPNATLTATHPTYPRSTSESTAKPAAASITEVTGAISATASITLLTGTFASASPTRPVIPADCRRVPMTRVTAAVCR